VINLTNVMYVRHASPVMQDAGMHMLVISCYMWHKCGEIYIILAAFQVIWVLIKWVIDWYQCSIVGLLILYGKYWPEFGLLRTELARSPRVQTRVNILPYKVNIPFFIYLLTHRYVYVKHGRYINCIIMAHFVIMKRCRVGDRAASASRRHTWKHMTS
jgi:hypothetical protein